MRLARGQARAVMADYPERVLPTYTGQGSGEVTARDARDAV